MIWLAFKKQCRTDLDLKPHHEQSTEIEIRQQADEICENANRSLHWFPKGDRRKWLRWSSMMSIDIRLNQKTCTCTAWASPKQWLHSTDTCFIDIIIYSDSELWRDTAQNDTKIRPFVCHEPNISWTEFGTTKASCTWTSKEIKGWRYPGVIAVQVCCVWLRLKCSTKWPVIDHKQQRTFYRGDDERLFRL